MRKNVDISPGRGTLLMLLVLAPLAAVVFSAIQTSHKGTRLSKLEKEIMSLKKENEALEISIVKSNSLISLSENTDELGFIKPERIVYLDKSSLFAKLP